MSQKGFKVNFSVRCPTVNMLGFVSHIPSVTTTHLQLQCKSSNDTRMTECGHVPIKQLINTKIGISSDTLVS